MPKTALVTIDLQQGLADRQGEPHPLPAIVERTAELAEAFRTRGLPVLTVVDVRLDPTPVPALVHDDHHHVEKRSWSAFDTSDVEARLQELGVERIVFVGVATSVGVEGTARSAHGRGYEVVVATDAVTDLDAGDHDHSLARVFPRLGELSTVKELIAALPSDG